MDALLSILVSAATIGFASAMISYDFDTSPSARHTAPMFYGYAPDKAASRAVCFLSMFSLSTAHVLLQTFSCVLLTFMNVNWLLYYLAANIELFIIVKIIRRDFFYFLYLTGWVRVLSSSMERFCVKILLDFTLMIHLRSPAEAGGFAFLMSLLFSLSASFVSI